MTMHQDVDADVATTGSFSSSISGQTITGGQFGGVPTIPSGTLTSGTITNSSYTGALTWFGASPSAILKIGGSSKSISGAKQKSKLRYVVIKSDGKTMEMRELPQITAREMIGISKLLSLISAYTAVVLAGGNSMYNFNISWSQLIEHLGIQKHFVDGLPVGDYNNDDEVLDIFLYDPK